QRARRRARHRAAPARRAAGALLQHRRTEERPPGGAGVRAWRGAGGGASGEGVLRGQRLTAVVSGPARGFGPAVRAAAFAAPAVLRRRGADLADHGHAAVPPVPPAFARELHADVYAPVAV